MPDFSNQTSTNNLWVDDLLVKDLSGHLKPYHQTKNSQNEAVSILPSNTVLEIAPSHELTTVQVAPADANFDFFHSGGKDQDSAIFVFHPEDHQQIEDFRQNLPLDDSKKYSVEKIASRIAEKNNFIFDKNNQELFNNVLLDFFRNRKNYTITREYLLTRIYSNGHNLSNQAVDHLGSIIKGIKERIDADGGLVVRQSDIKAVKIASLPPESKVPINDSFEPVAVAVKTEEIKPAEIKPVPAPLTPSTTSQVKPASEATAVLKAVPEMPSAPPLPKVRRVEMPAVDKPSVSDVVSRPSAILEKTKQTLTGPVQELESMTLATFRRYGNTGEERAQKILQKINVLEKDSVTKKTMGITAWRQSPVYKLYLDLGSGSLLKGQEISQMIAERQLAGQAVLTLEEFHAIGDLNKLLRF